MLSQRINKTAIEDAYPLSMLQQGMIFHSLQKPHLNVYHDIMLYHFESEWEVSDFRKSLSILVDKHAALRTLFHLDGAKPLQVVVKNKEADVDVINIRNISDELQGRALEKWLKNEKAKGVDLSSFPWKISVHLLGDSRILIGLSFHHAILDGWSVANFINELFTTYSLLRSQVEVTASKPPPPYKNFIALEQASLKSEDNRLYWKNSFSGAKLPWWSGDRQGKSVHVSHLLNKKSSQKLSALAHALGAQEKSVWCAVYLMLLSLLDGENDVVGSVVLHGRPEIPGSEKTLGLFLNSLPVRMDIAGMRWIDLIGAVETQLQQLYSMRHFPLIKIQTETGLNFSASMFNYTNFHVYGEGDTDKYVTAGGGFEETNYLLSFQVSKNEKSGLYSAYIGLDAAVFDQEFQDRIQAYLVNTVDHLLSDNQSVIDKTAFLAQAEREKLLEEWISTEREYPADKSIHQLFEKQAADNPDTTALVFDKQQLSYAELNCQSNRLAHYLISQGVGPEVRVGICIERSLEMVVGILGILKAGACYVPLDPKYPMARLRYLIVDSGVDLVVTSSTAKKTLDFSLLSGAGEDQQPSTNDIRYLYMNESESWPMLAESFSNPSVNLNPLNLACLIYTSGSTGAPKGVGIQHKSVVSLLNWSSHQWSFAQRQGVLASTSMCFDLSVYEMFLPLVSGSQCIITDSILSLNNLPDKDRVTLINTVPSAAKALLEENALPASLKVINLAGEALKSSLVDDIYQQTGVDRIYDLYGPSEDTTYTTFTPRELKGPETIGRPIDNTKLYILDQSAKVVPTGVVGELYIGGEGLARGYRNRPALTAEKFVPNPFSQTPGARLYRTGDLIRYLPDGNLKYIGRIDQQVKLRGFRIELGEIEAVLQNCAGVDEVVVVVREDRVDDRQLVAYIVLTQASDNQSVANAEASWVHELREQAQAQLPLYMVPSAIVVLDSLPLTANGKVDRKALPAPDLSGIQADYVAPEGVSEELLASLWQDLLSVERVGATDNFFALGGHSLLVTQLLSRIRESFSVELSIRNLFEQQTLSAQAQAVAQAHTAQDGATDTEALGPITPVPRDRALLPSYAQQRLWFLSQYQGTNAVYNMPLALRLRGRIDSTALLNALAEIVRRHESLRTRFGTDESGQPIQIIDPPPPPPTVESLAEGSSLQSVCSAEHSRAFDLQRDELCRLRVIEDHTDVDVDKSYLLLITMHHSISDAWSLGIFWRELVTVYQAFARGEPSPLTPLAIQYADYAHWQRDWLEGARLARQLRYWQEQLQGMPTLLDLPTDRPRPAEQSFRGRTESFALPEALSTRLQALSDTQGVTLFMTLLSAFSILLSRYSQQDDVAVGTPIANRTRRETEGLIGFFVNTLVMRCQLGNDPSFVQLLKRTREMALQSYEHQDVPFEHLVEALNPERSLSHSPLFQVMFALQNVPLDGIVLDDVELSPLSEEHDAEADDEGISRFDLTLSLRESPEGLAGELEYNSDLFDRSRIQRMLAHYECLLQEIVASPNTAVSRYELLSEQEKQQQRFDWNKSLVVYPPEQGIHQLFQTQAEQQPDALAIVCPEQDETSQQQLSYDALNTQANRLAHYLLTRGLQRGTIAAVSAEPSAALLVGLLGVLKAGGCYLWLDPRQPALRQGYQIEDSAVRWIVTQGDVAELHSAAQTSVQAAVQNAAQTSVQTAAPKIQTVALTDPELQQQCSENPELRVHPAQSACVEYSAGRNHSLLGKHISHQGLNSAVHSDSETAAETGTGTVDCMRTAALWIGDQHVALWRPLLQGGCLNLSTAHPLQTEVFGEALATGDLLAPIPNHHSAYLLDSRGQMLPEGAIGELHLGGPGVAYAQFPRASQTAEYLIPDVFSQTGGERLYRSGHRVRHVTDKGLVHIGKHQAQQAGQALTARLAELEQLLLQHAAVEAVALVNTVSGSQDQAVGHVVGYVVPSKNTAAENDAVAPRLQEALIRGLRDYLREQRRVCPLPMAFVVMEALPMTAEGVLDKTALPMPQALSDSPQAYVAPQTATEQTLVLLWQEKLGLETVGIEDNYFVLGGDSIRSISLVAEAEKRGLAFSVKDLFAYPTIAALAAMIDGGRLVSEPGMTEDIAPFALLSESERRVVREQHVDEVLEDAYPLSMLQQGMVLLALEQQHLNLYENFQVYRFRGVWNATQFARALTYLTNKHPLLKSVFDLSTERPLQLILMDRKPVFNVVELSADDEASISTAVDRWMSEEKQRGIDTAEGLWRATVFLLPDDQFLYGMFLHHALWDGWSLESFVTQLYSTYAYLQENNTIPSERPLPSYKQFIAMEQAAINSEEQQSYWHNKVDGLHVPWWTGREKLKGNNIDCFISETSSRRMIDLARRLEVQEKSVWCAMYLTLLSVLDGGDEVAGNVLTQGRPEILDGDKIVGVFLNALPIGISVTGKSWMDFIRSVDSELREQHEYRRYPLAEIQRLSDLNFSGALFNYTNWHVYYEQDEQTGGHGGFASDELVPDKVAGWAETNYSLLVDVFKDERTQRFGLSINADTGVFDEEFSERLQKYAANIIREMEFRPAAMIDKSALLGRDELDLLVLERNRTQTEYSKEKCLHELFEAQVRNNPDRIAVIQGADDGTEIQQLSYRELNCRSNQLAHYLVSQGVGPEVRVGICAERSILLLTGVLGILKAGGGYVPIDPNHPAKRRDYLISDSGIEILLTQEDLANEIGFASTKTLFPLDSKNWSAEMAGMPDTDIDVTSMGLTPRNLSYLIYTSGSTGQPKGVMGMHQSIVNRVNWLQREVGVEASDVLCQKTNLSFVDHVAEIFQALTSGVPLVIFSNELVQTPKRLVDALNSWCITQFTLVPSLLNILISTRGVTVPRMRAIYCSGEALALESTEHFRRCFPKSRLLNIYGSTEVGADVSAYELQPGEIDHAASEALPIGRFISNIEGYVLGTQGQVLPTGVVGELCIGGTGLARGYLNRAGLTAERFVPNPFARTPGERLYRTGDLVRYSADGNLNFAGRIDHQVKLRGIRIELGEIESVLENHESVKDVVVLSGEDEHNDSRLLAYIVADTENSSGLVNELRQQAQMHLPAYMVPSLITVLEALPLSSTGKLDRGALPAPDWSSLQTEYVAPEGDIEEQLAGLWKDLLNIDQIGRFDNFFALGGHSLLAIRLLSAIHNEFEVNIPIRIFFENSSLLQTAQMIGYLGSKRKSEQNSDAPAAFDELVI